MPFDISLTAGMRADLTSLQGTALLLNRTQTRLSTGKSVNSAVDNPSAYFAAQDHLNHASDLAARKSQMGEAIQALTAANQGITSITTLINQAQGLVQSAQSSNTTTRGTLAAQFNAIRTQIDQLASDSGYNGKNFLAGDTLSVLFNETGNSTLSVTGFSGNSTGLGITTAAYGTGASVTNEAVGGSANGFFAAGSYTLATTGLVVTATVAVTQTYNATGEVVIGNISGTSGQTYVLSGLAANTAAVTNVVVYATGTAITAGAYSVAVSGHNIEVIFAAGGSTSSGAVTVGYTTVNTVTASNYTLAAGGGSTQGSLTFAANTTGTVTVNYGVSTLWASDTALTTDTTNLNTAISTLRAQASTMAANLSVISTRQTWSQSMITNYQTGSDNLTLADMNEEGANMLALQTRQQLGIQALSLASQANQSIIRLFG